VSERTLPGEELLAGIAERDYARIESCFAETARFSVLTPRPLLREHEGPEEAAERYRFWLEPLEHFELLESDVVEIADRIRIRYLFRGEDPAKGWQLNEHTGYAEVEDGRIRSMILTCAGFRRTTAP
jgi:SnoaL-like domain